MANDVVDQVRDRTDIVEVIGQHVQLRKAGRSFKGLCPFHQEKTPSFVVFPETQTFHCFGCGAGGDVFSFVMQSERIEFREALRSLAERAGITLEVAAPPPAEEVERHAHLFDLNRRAATFFSHVLWNTTAGAAGRRVLEERGVDRATAERFQLGFAPDGWDTLLSLFTKRGVSIEDLAAAGLVTQRDDGSTYDRFRNRLMFPIRDREGRIVGFGGRALGDAQPKYLNSPQTAIFDKSANLYAIDLAQEAIRRQHEVVVVEGYMDAVAAHQFGFANVVASMGTALTDAQANLLRRGVDRIILALDADAAGQMATVRGLDVLRESLSEADRPQVDERGLIRFERTLKTEIRIVRLPSGKDPDELIRRDPDAWRQALESTVPLLDFYVDAIIGDPPPAEPREKSARVDRLRGVLWEITDPVVQGHYVRLIAQRLDLPEGAILGTRPGAARRPRPVAPAQPARPRHSVTTEDHLFALVLRYPDLLAGTLAEIPEQDVVDSRHRAMLQVLRGLAPEQIGSAIEQMPEELRDHVAYLRSLADLRPGRYPGQIRREAAQVIQRLRKERLDQRMRQLLADVADAERRQDGDGVRHTLALIDQLKARYPEFYPGPSPYFRDVRDTGM